MANRKHSAGRIFCQKILESPEYLESVMRRMLSDSLPPAVEIELQHYAWGKPIERIAVAETESLASLQDLSDDALAEHAADVARQALESAKQEKERLRLEALALLEQSPGAIAEREAAAAGVKPGGQAN